LAGARPVGVGGAFGRKLKEISAAENLPPQIFSRDVRPLPTGESSLPSVIGLLTWAWAPPPKNSIDECLDNETGGMQTGPTEEVVRLEPLHLKFEAFGFAVRECDGNSTPELLAHLESVPFCC
jgi:hypothetical protein